MARLVVGHLAVLIVGTSWGFGGMAPWTRLFAAGWGTLGIALFVFLILRGTARRAIHHLWPLVAFDALVIASVFNPNMVAVPWGTESLRQAIEPRFAALPSATRGDAALEQLWVLNALILSCYNVFSLNRRKSLRILLGVVAGNALVLAVFGTMQKLSGADGIWFGATETPQTYFFASFVYHNHWGAFTILNVAACLGLLFHVLRRDRERDFWHSPALAGAVAIALLCATAPLSGSRSSTLLLALFGFGALVHFFVQLVRARRQRMQSTLSPVVAIACAAIVTLAAIGWLARDVIDRRTRLTVSQVEQIRANDLHVPRLVLYRDTWRAAMEKPWFGWGLASYPDVFPIYNSQRAVELWFGQPFYRDAHSDWLQSVAETGFIGTGLLLALGLAPLVTAVRTRTLTALPRYLLIGCGLVAAYAWVEFPFANLSVIIAFWCSLYVAARYALLDREARKPLTAGPHA